MKTTAIVVAAVFSLVSLLPQRTAQAQADAKSLPQTMHLCTNHCETLVWMQDHYDGKADDSGVLMSQYTVNRWDQEVVDFIGVPVKQNPLAKIRASFKGSILPNGGGIANPKVTVSINSVPTIRDAAYQLTWETKEKVAPTTAGVPPPQVAAPTTQEPTPSVPASDALVKATNPSTEASTTSLLGRDLAAEQALLDEVTRSGQHLNDIYWRQLEAGLPRRLYECEVLERRGKVEPEKTCGVWEYANHQYTGHWLDGTQGQMFVGQFDSDRVLISRYDFAGSMRGRKATYEGKWNGSAIVGGRVNSTIRGSFMYGEGTWTATLSPQNPATDAVPPPTAKVSDLNAVTVNWDEASKLLAPRSSPLPFPLPLISYPRLAIMTHATGDLWLTLSVSLAGQVIDVQETAGRDEGLFLDSTVKDIKQWQFRLYMQNGMPSAIKTSIHVKFGDKGVEILDK